MCRTAKVSPCWIVASWNGCGFNYCSPHSSFVTSVYEFSVALARSDKKVVVYVGESTDLHRRHHNDYRGPGGSHIKECFETALAVRFWNREALSAHLNAATALAVQSSFQCPTQRDCKATSAHLDTATSRPLYR